MATVDKDFRVKHGLVVEGSTATVNGNNVITDGDTTDVLDEGTTNLYFTDERAVDAVATAIGNGTHTNITITYDDETNAISFSGSSPISTTDDLTEGTTNLYFTETRARDSLSGGSGITYTAATGEIAVDTNTIATRSYVDGAVSGLTWKPAVNLFAATNVALSGSTGTLVIDGHAALDNGDDGYRILLTAQTTDSENGIYVYNDDGSGYTLTRAADADTFQELNGAAVFVMEGTTYGSTSWVQSNHYLTDFTAQEWDQFSGQGTYTGGTGISVLGNEFSIDFTEFDTDDITEGTTNFYYTDQRVKDVLTGSTQTNISITEVEGALVITAENGVDDATTDDLDEGTTNLYFTDQRAIDALDGANVSVASINFADVATNVAFSTLVESTSTPEAVAIFDKTAFRSAKFLVKMSTATHTQLSEILVTLDSVDNIAITEYAIVGTNGSMGDLTADISGNDVRLIADVNNANTTVKVFGTLVE